MYAKKKKNVCKKKKKYHMKKTTKIVTSKKQTQTHKNVTFFSPGTKKRQCFVFLPKTNKIPPCYKKCLHFQHIAIGYTYLSRIRRYSCSASRLATKPWSIRRPARVETPAPCPKNNRLRRWPSGQRSPPFPLGEPSRSSPVKARLKQTQKKRNF